MSKKVDIEKRLEEISDELNKLRGVDSGDELDEPEGLQYVIVRTYSAGVHAGFLVKEENQRVTLAHTRRLHYWDGAFTLSALAKIGTTKPHNCQFSVEIDEIHLLEAIEIIPTTEKAKQSLRGVPTHDPK